MLDLERTCFAADRRDPPAVIRASLAHPRHEIWVLEGRAGRIEGAIFLRHLRGGLRVYSLATHPDRRGEGWGRRLMTLAEARGRAGGHRRMTLEADDRLPELLRWYEALGYARGERLAGFYGEGRDAWRFSKAIDPLPGS